jgi:hypothetical protein
VIGRLGVDITPGSIDMPDGTTTTWRMAGVAALTAEPYLPFFIGYDQPVDARSLAGLPADSPEGISWVEVAGDRTRLDEWLGGAELDVRVIDGEPGVRAAGLATAGGDIVLR